MSENPRRPLRDVLNSVIRVSIGNGLGNATLSARRSKARVFRNGDIFDHLRKNKDVPAPLPGRDPVSFRLQNPARKESLISVGLDIRVNPSEQLIAEIESVLGAGVVSLL